MDHSFVLWIHLAKHDSRVLGPWLAHRTTELWREQPSYLQVRNQGSRKSSEQPQSSGKLVPQTSPVPSSNWPGCWEGQGIREWTALRWDQEDQDSKAGLLKHSKGYIHVQKESTQTYHSWKSLNFRQFSYQRYSPLGRTCWTETTWNNQGFSTSLISMPWMRWPCHPLIRHPLISDS